jgi:hypothetical protein
LQDVLIWQVLLYGSTISMSVSNCAATFCVQTGMIQTNKSLTGHKSQTRQKSYRLPGIVYLYSKIWSAEWSCQKRSLIDEVLK